MKDKIRKKAKELRKTLQTEILSQMIVENIRHDEIYKSKKNIMIFYPLTYEVNLLSLIQDSNKQFFIPKMKGETLTISKFSIETELDTVQFHIKEANSDDSEFINSLDIIFIPALAVDDNGYRVGYGKGFYDRFLKQIDKRTIKATVIFDALKTENIPNCKNDVKSDWIVSESGILKI